MSPWMHLSHQEGGWWRSRYTGWWLRLHFLAPLFPFPKYPCASAHSAKSSRCPGGTPEAAGTEKLCSASRSHSAPLRLGTFGADVWRSVMASVLGLQVHPHSMRTTPLSLLFVLGSYRSGLYQDTGATSGTQPERSHTRN